MRILIIEDENCWPIRLKPCLSKMASKPMPPATAKPVSIMLRWEFMTC